MDNLVGYPSRNLIRGAVFMLVVWTAATFAYMAAGWSFATRSTWWRSPSSRWATARSGRSTRAYLHAVTIATMVLGCTGMILLTGALVQFITLNRTDSWGSGACTQIESSTAMSSSAASAASASSWPRSWAGGGPSLWSSRTQRQIAQARDLGYLCIQGDATEETALLEAGIMRARTLATVLPDDAANVFITLSARSLNPPGDHRARRRRHREQAAPGRCQQGRAADPYRRRTHRRNDPVPRKPPASSAGPQRMRDLEGGLRGLGLEMEVMVARDNTAVVGRGDNRRLGTLGARAPFLRGCRSTTATARPSPAPAGRRGPDRGRRRLGGGRPHRAGDQRAVRGAPRKGAGGKVDVLGPSSSRACPRSIQKRASSRRGLASSQVLLAMTVKCRGKVDRLG